jgi:hypothetical protein
LFTFFPPEFDVAAGASRSVQVLFPSVETLVGTQPTELLSLMLSTSGESPGSVVVTVGAITQTPLAVGVSAVSPIRITEAALTAGDVPVTVTLENAAQAESVAAIDLFLNEETVIRNTVTHTAGSSDVSFALSSADVGGHYGRYRVFAVPYGAGGTGTPISSSLSVYIAGQAQDAWISELTLSANEQSQTVRFGSALNASDANVTDEDALMPPAGGGSSPYLIFRLDGAAMRRDIRSVPESGRIVWNVEATVPDGYTGTLTWQNLDYALPYYDNALLEQGSKAFDMRRHSSMTLPSGTHFFELVMENSRPQSLSGTINIGLGGWAMLSLPGGSEDASPEALGAQGFSTIYGWDGATQEFEVIRPGESLVPVGSGYVVNRDPSLSSTLNFEWDVNTDQPAARIADVTLYPGWNLVGVPIQGVSKAVFGVPNDNVIEWRVEGYETVTATTLEPFRSYWIFNNGSVRTIVLAQERHHGTIAGNALDGTEVPSAPLVVLKPDWSFGLNLVTSDGRTRTVTLGSNPRAKAGMDDLDAPLPPSLARGLPEFYVTAKDAAVRMRRSIVPIANRRAEWTLVAQLPGSGTIEWAPVRLPDGYRLRLTVGGAEYDLTHDGSAVLEAGRHALTVTYDWKAPTATAVLTNFPNPFNPETWIPFELKEDSVVKVTIFDVTGTVVRRLDLGYREKGYYTSRSDAAYWDGRNEFGEPASSGLYFYEFRTATYRTVRRMLLAK